MLQVSAVQAQSSCDSFPRVTPQKMADILQKAGYRAEVVEKNNKRFIRTGLGGYNVGVDFYDCGSKPDCSAIQFYAVFNKTAKLNIEYANRWNKSKRYAKAYIDSDGDFILTFDVDLDGGVSCEYLREKISLFEGSLSAFNKF